MSESKLKLVPGVYTVEINKRYRELKEFLAFNFANIDEKLQQHAALNQEVCENVLLAYKKVSQLELVLEEMEALTKLEHREAFDRRGEKATEGKIIECTNSNTSIVDLKQQLSEAKAEHTKWSDLRYSFQSMGRNLETHSKLIISGFLAQ